MRRPIWDDLCRDLVASVHREAATSIVLKTDIDSALLPTNKESDGAHCERARHECPEIRISELRPRAPSW